MFIFVLYLSNAFDFFPPFICINTLDEMVVSQPYVLYTEGTNSLKICVVIFVCVCFVLCLWSDWFC